MVTNLYKNLKEKQKQVILYIKNHKNVTTKKIKSEIGIKVEKAFKYGIREAFKRAGVELPKHLLRRNKNYCRKLVIDYIIANPNCTSTEIHSKLKINIWRLFGSIENAFDNAKVTYVRKQKYNELRKKVLELVKENPTLTSTEIYEKTRINLYNIFKNMHEVYSLAKIKPISFRKKRIIKKQNEVISYIIKHPESTQWEINKNCKTHVQELFKGGIREAFEKAKIVYPESRRILYGTSNLSIRRRSLVFEKRVVNILKKFGKIHTQIKTKNGIIDVILNYKEQIIPIEIKDYRSKPISRGEIKQLEKYLDDLKCNFGIIISSKGDKKEFNLNSGKIIKVLPIRYIVNHLGSSSNLARI